MIDTCILDSPPDLSTSVYGVIGCGLQVKLFGPRVAPTVMGGVPLDHFLSTEMQQHAVLR